MSGFADEGVAVARQAPRRHRVSGPPGAAVEPEQQQRRHGVVATPEVPVAPSAPPRRRPPLPVADQPVRRRRVMVGLAAEAAAQAEQARRGSGTPEPSSRRERSGERLPAQLAGSAVARYGTCPCGLPASTTCASGCGRPTCGQHLLNRASRLGWPGPYKSEREHTAYLRAFWASATPLCTWCRETAGAAALAALPPVAPLPDGALERLAFLLRHPHDYPGDAWEQTVRQHGGAVALLRLLAPRVSERKSAQEFGGRSKGDFLTGVSVGSPATQGTYEVVDAAGVVWTVRPRGNGVMRKRRAWSWERAPEDRVAQLLPRILELAAL